MSLSTLPITSSVYSEIEKLLEEDPEASSLEIIAEIECDEEDIELQAEDDSNDPIASLHLIAQWHPAAQGGILDWFFLPLSAIQELGEDADEAELAERLMHGGSLFAFRYEGQEPDLDSLLQPAVNALNETISWAEFAIDDETE